MLSTPAPKLMTRHKMAIHDIDMGIVSSCWLKRSIHFQIGIIGTQSEANFIVFIVVVSPILAFFETFYRFHDGFKSHLEVQ